MAPAATPPATLLADIAAADIASLHAHLSGRRTRGSLNARLDTEKQDTLLTWAARHGQAEAVRLLLEGGASVGATTGGGAPALFIACDQEQIECARLLLEAGNPHSRLKSAKSLFHPFRTGPAVCAGCPRRVTVTPTSSGSLTHRPVSPLHPASTRARVQLTRASPNRR